MTGPLPQERVTADAGALAAADCLPAPQLRQLQNERLRRTVARACQGVPLYRQRLAEAGIAPATVAAVDDLVRLPFITKDDLRQAYPRGLFAVPLDQILRLHASSGTTGTQVLVPYTRGDLAVWTEVMVRALGMFGIVRGDIVQNAYGYGLFTGGLGFHYAAEALGATVIPVSGGNADRQLTVLRDFCSTVICCTPSVFLHVADRAAEVGLDLRQLSLRVGVFGAEPWSEAMRVRIEQAAGLEAFDIYGLAEIVGPGVAAECSAHRGLHVLEDHFFPEIVDPETGTPLPDGTAGELVLTTLTKEALPMLRYRTGDITTLTAEPCGCGRTLRRIARVSHRSDDLFIIRGVNVFPAQIEAALLAVEGTLPHYQIVLRDAPGQPPAEVQVELSPDMFTDRIGDLEALRGRLVRAVQQAIGVYVDVRLVEPRTLARSEGKARRVLDQRRGRTTP